MLKRKDKVVKGLTDGVAFLFKKNKIDPVFGTAKLLGKGKVEINGAGARTPRGEDTCCSPPAARVRELPFLKFDGTECRQLRPRR